MDVPTDVIVGLSEAEAKVRLAQAGYNEIREESFSPVRGVLKRLWGPIPWMLEAAHRRAPAISPTASLRQAKREAVGSRGLP